MNEVPSPSPKKYKKKKRRVTTTTTSPAMDEVDETNGWTDENCNTIQQLRDTLKKYVFVYYETADYYDKLIQISLILSLLIGTIMTVISALTITLGSFDNQFVVLGLNVGMLTGSAIIAIINGLQKIFSWDDKQKQYSIHSQRLFGLYITLKSELKLHESQRFNASSFIKRKMGEYANLIQSGPILSTKEESALGRKFYDNEKDEATFNLKHSKFMTALHFDEEEWNEHWKEILTDMNNKKKNCKCCWNSSSSNEQNTSSFGNEKIV
jgi:hypothetical protein